VATLKEKNKMSAPIFLIGFMGAGKSFYGPKWANELRKNYVDLDDYIESKTNKTITALFDFYGEQNFRAFEQQMLQEVVLKQSNVIIACGGGTPCFNGNMDFMNDNGTTLYLKVSVEELCKRLFYNQSKRPLLQNKTAEELHEFVTNKLAERSVFYEKAKHIIINDGNTLINIADILTTNEK
jgi:shikimate kinase